MTSKWSFKLFFIISILLVTFSVILSCGGDSESSANKGEISPQGTDLSVSFPAPEFLRAAGNIDFQCDAKLNGGAPTHLTVNPDDTVSGIINDVSPGTYLLELIYFVPTGGGNDIVLCTYSKSIDVYGEKTTVSILDSELNRNHDSDGDGHTNLEEVGHRTDPFDATSFPDTYFQDLDGDGYGNPKQSVNEPRDGYVSNNTDCDDDNSAIYPGASDSCDGKDNNCNNLIDEDAPLLTFYHDGDNDRYGDPDDSIQACAAPPDYVAGNTDCDDLDPSVNPLAAEIPYDTIDQDCDGDDLIDVDGDGYPSVVVGGPDIDDNNPDIHSQSPSSPVVVGESSAGHNDVTWQWSVPEGTDTFQWYINNGAVHTVPASTTTITETLPMGDHAFSVRACNVYGDCSVAAIIETTVEIFGAGVWQGVQKSLPASPLNNSVAIACHNCYDGPVDEIYDSAAANIKISHAVNRGADFIEIDVSDIGGLLFATHVDAASAEQRPTLAAILDNITFKASDAMLMIEIKEGDVLPEIFADQLLSVLNANRDFVRNGRPVIVKAFDDKLNYVTAVKHSASNYPFIEHYIRYWLLYSSRNNIANWQTEIKKEVIDTGLDGVEVDYRSENIFGVLTYARSFGLGTGIWTLPGPLFGEVSIAAMREDVDLMISEYRVDYARDIIEAHNCAAYFNSYPLTPISSTIPVLYNNSGTAVSVDRLLNIEPSPTAYGSPSVVRWDIGKAMFGGILNFQDDARAIGLFDFEAGNDEGFLVTAVVTLGDTTPPNGQTVALLNKSQQGGFVLELHTFSEGKSVLRFGVYVGGNYIYHSYPVEGGSASAVNGGDNGIFTAPLNETDAYFLTGAYDGDGGVYLFINNKCAGAARPAISGGVTESGVASIAGADPEASESTQARYYYDGYMQQASIQLWGDHSGQGIND